ncbi:MAG: VapA/VapB family virulence-associated protein [Enterobacteriaceae bacterium]|nr:VapA/VapB family virulence-associated protein [Enterobacteriaceae bacterium]
MNGCLYTDNLEQLYTDTVFFNFTLTMLETNIHFYDLNRHLLGHVIGESLSFLQLLGSGKGKWFN